jgi:hypothetical protein
MGVTVGFGNVVGVDNEAVAGRNVANDDGVTV